MGKFIRLVTTNYRSILKSISQTIQGELIRTMKRENPCDLTYNRPFLKYVKITFLDVIQFEILFILFYEKSFHLNQQRPGKGRVRIE